MSATIDQQFVEYVVKSLVEKPDAVVIDRRVDEKGVLLELTVDPEDLGRVIGKRGATAQSLRTLLRALGTKNEARYNLRIVDNGAPKPGAVQDDASAPVGNSTDDDAGDTDSDAPLSTDNPAMMGEEKNKYDIVAEYEDAQRQHNNYDETTAKEQDQANDRLARARKELADLDDLDI
ncbi:KH domain-containing protein [Candidatus Saccharibacteria bacterium]|nr:KH domain-containing protein [Candidatus Saccharibacteria bacterium]